MPHYKSQEIQLEVKRASQENGKRNRIVMSAHNLEPGNKVFKAYLPRNDLLNDSSQRIYAYINEKLYEIHLDPAKTLDKECIYIPGPIREYLGIEIDSKISFFLLEERPKIQTIKIINIGLNPSLNKSLSNKLDQIELNKNILSNVAKLTLASKPVYQGQEYVAMNILDPEDDNGGLKSLVARLKVIDLVSDAEDKMDCGFVTEETEIRFTLPQNELFRLDDYTGLAPENHKMLARLHHDLPKVGGLSEQISRVINEVFLTRALSKSARKQYGIKHTRGVLMYGPPGTGKTLSAREIGAMFTNGNNIHVVKGPELLNKYVGESEKTLREVFKPAIDEYARKKDKSELHIFIFDELEALFPNRSNDNSSSKVGSNMTATMLNIMDGIDSPDNFVVFGITNLPESLDPALRRPGRFNMHLEFGLPNHQGRYDILQIHAKKIIENKLLDEDVDLNELAKRTENWTGAELAELIAIATRNAISRNFSTNEESKIEMNHDVQAQSQLEVVTCADIEYAFSMIKPAHAGGITKLNFDVSHYSLYSEKLQKQFKQCLEAINAIRQGVCSIGIVGKEGAGKTSFAVKLAEAANFSCIEYIDIAQFPMATIVRKQKAIEEKFKRCLDGERSIIIIDNVEDVIGADPTGIQFSNQLRIYLKSKLRMLLDADKHLTIVVTSNNQELFKNLGFESSCQVNCQIEAPANKEECQSIVGAYQSHLELNNVQSKTPRELLFMMKLHQSKQLSVDDNRKTVGYDRMLA